QPNTTSILWVSRAVARTVRGSESLDRGESTATSGTLGESNNQAVRAHDTANGSSDHDRRETEGQCPPRRSHLLGGCIPCTRRFARPRRRVDKLRSAEPDRPFRSLMGVRLVERGG